MNQSQKIKHSITLRYLIAILILPIFMSCNTDDKGGLEDKIQTLELTHILWACDCADWTTNKNIEKYSGNKGDLLGEDCIFIEPASELLKLSDTLGYSGDIIRFKGQFYNKKGFPKNYESEQNPKKSRVFRYTEYKVLRSNFAENQELKNVIK